MHEPEPPTPPRNPSAELAALQGRRALLHDADPLLAVEPEVAVGDHGAGFLQLVLGAKDQRDGPAHGGTHLAAGRVERGGAGRVRVGETRSSTDETVAGGLAHAGVGGVLEERSERLGELGDAVQRLDGRPVAMERDTRRSV